MYIFVDREVVVDKIVHILNHFHDLRVQNQSSWMIIEMFQMLNLIQNY